MSSPKGTSKHPQSAMYKGGKSKLVEQSDVEAHLADGWCDNPAEVTPDEPTPDADAEETPPDGPVAEESAAEETGTDEAG